MEHEDETNKIDRQMTAFVLILGAIAYAILLFFAGEPGRFIFTIALVVTVVIIAFILLFMKKF